MVLLQHNFPINTAPHVIYFFNTSSAALSIFFYFSHISPPWRRISPPTGWLRRARPVALRPRVRQPLSSLACARCQRCPLRRLLCVDAPDAARTGPLAELHLTGFGGRAHPPQVRRPQHSSPTCAGSSPPSSCSAMCITSLFSAKAGKPHLSMRRHMQSCEAGVAPVLAAGARANGRPLLSSDSPAVAADELAPIFSREAHVNGMEERENSVWVGPA